MINSLRARMMLSHILPVLIIVPLMGFFLLNVAETRILLPSLVGELQGNALLLADIAGKDSRIWQSPMLAQALLSRTTPSISAKVMLLTLNGTILASNAPIAVGDTSALWDINNLQDVAQGRVIAHMETSPTRGAEVIEVLAPARDADLRVIGIVRLTYAYDTVSEKFAQARSLILTILAAGLGLGAVMGLGFGVTLSQPIRNVTRRVNDLATGTRSEPIRERGPAEVQALAQSVNSLVNRLQSMEAARRRLLANLVHELGRPLGALRSGVHALTHGAEQDPILYHDLLNGMDVEMARLQRLLEELAHLHDQVLGALELNRQIIQISPWLLEILTPWQAAAQEKHLRYRQTVADDLPGVSIDPDRMAQVIGNLMSNAVKFTPPDGMVEVSAGVKKGVVWVSVSDSGPGISAEEQTHIFDSFYRGTQGRRFPQGMGLGLNIANDLTEAHNGRLLVQSEVGKGSRFTVEIPL